MDVWLVWLLLAAALGAAELFTLSAALGLLGGAAAVTAAAAALGLPVPVQLLVFVAAAGTGIWLVRPVVLRHLHAEPTERFGVDALVGRTAHVVREVSGQGGSVRIDGDEWTARPTTRTPPPSLPARPWPSWPSAAPPRSCTPGVESTWNHC